MKTCSKCGLSKPPEEFHNNATKLDGLNHSCKICQREYNRQHYNKNKSYYIAKSKRSGNTTKDLIDKLKAQPCIDCGKSYPPYVMDFDHVSGKKNNNVSSLAKHYSRAKALKEIEKCELVCSNCHRERTHKRRHGS